MRPVTSLGRRTGKLGSRDVGAVCWDNVKMAIPAIGASTRWRCAQCGNLTRFDVTRTTRVREFLHVGLSGDSHVEEREVLTDRVEHVTCRWCAGVDTVEAVARPDAAGDGAGNGTVAPHQ